MSLEPIICACGCGHRFTPKKAGLRFINRGHANRRKDRPKQKGGMKYPKRCGRGTAGIAI